jgi:hypothetical protein
MGGHRSARFGMLDLAEAVWKAALVCFPAC